jgi:hypothetical protein
LLVNIRTFRKGAIHPLTHRRMGTSAPLEPQKR